MSHLLPIHSGMMEADGFGSHSFFWQERRPNTRPNDGPKLRARLLDRGQFLCAVDGNSFVLPEFWPELQLIFVCVFPPKSLETKGFSTNLTE